MSARDKGVIGWREWASLPLLGIRLLKVKIDTGARTSALHAFNIKPFDQDGRTWVRFDVHPYQRDDVHIRTCSAPTLDYRWVTNSGGKREKRFVIETPISMDGLEWPIELTLAGRDQMGFRMLLGRTALNGRFVIDPARSYCMRRPERTGRRLFKEKSKARRIRDEEE